MASSKFRILPDKEEKTLFLVMDGDNNLTGHPKTIDRMLERRETTEVRIIRLLASSADSEDFDESDDDGRKEKDTRPKVKLTVEEILPEMDDDGKTVDSAVPPDFVDPLSQLDMEQMLKLKKALASEQAKQILGDNVTAMLDVLSVDENPTVFLQNSIRRDHCYTPLSPSADPKGASFVLSPNNNVENVVKRSKGRPPKTDGAKASGSGLCQSNKQHTGSTPTANATDSNEGSDDEEYDNSSDDSDSDDRDRSSDSDYRDRNSGFGMRGRRRGNRGGLWGSRRMRGAMRGRVAKRRPGRPRRERRPSEEVSVDDTESPEPAVSVAVPVAHTPSRSPGKRGRPRKAEQSTAIAPKTLVTTVSSASSAATIVPETVVTPIDHAAAKVYSADAIRLGRPSGKSEEERRRDMARILQSLDAGGRGRKVIFIKKGTRQPVPPKPDVEPAAIATPAPPKSDEVLVSVEGLEEGEVIAVRRPESKPIRTYVRRESGSKDTKDQFLENNPVKIDTVQAAPVRPTFTPSHNVMGGKYPRRENRKLPSHLADTVGPELFSAPDVLRKKNLAGIVDDVKNKPNGKTVQRSLLRYVKKSLPNSSPSRPAQAGADSPKAENSTSEVPSKELVETPEADSLAAAVDELQSMLEEGLNETLEEPLVVSKEPIAAVEPEKTPSKQPNPSLKHERARKTSEKETKVIESRRTSGKQGSEPESDTKQKHKEITEHIDISQMNASLLHELPAGSMDELILSVVDTPGENRLDRENVSNKPVRVGKTSRDEKKSNDRDEGPGKSSSELKSPIATIVTKVPRSSIEGKECFEPDESRLSIEQSPLQPDSAADESSSAAEERRRNATKRRRSDEVSDLDSDLDDTLSEASWNSEDDPDKLWCICRKPHNNRFMICCDVCEDWFHGKCVGISKSIGKQMEQDGLEWSCPQCTKKKRLEEKEKEAKQLTKPIKLPEMRQSIQTKLSGFAIKQPSAEEAPVRKCIMCKGPVRENSIYCSDQCIRKHSQRAIAQLSSANKQPGMEKPATSAIEPTDPRKGDRRVIVMDPTSKKVLTGPSAPTVSNLATWLQQNPSFHVLFQKRRSPGVGKDESVKKIVQVRPVMTSKVLGDAKATQLKLTVSPNSKNVKIISQVAGQPVLKVVPSGIGKKNQIVTVKSESDASLSAKSRLAESPKVSEKKFYEAPKPTPRRRKEKLQVLQDYKSPTTSKMDEPKEKTGSGGAGEQAIRDSVRKTLGESLKARVADATDLDVKKQDIDILATKIEERLYKLFENKVDVKYKSKYRSLVFNIKDQKNETLFRKIVENSISPKELVRLTADEMASQELAQWREKENQHQLEIIKKTELELMTQGQTFIMKSHKGEEVIEKDLKVAAVAAEIDPNTPAQELVSALNSVSSTTSDTVDPDEKGRDAETSLMKMKKKEKERRREKEKKHKRERDRSSRHSKSKKRSRSRSRDRRRRSRDRKDSKSRSSRHSRDSKDTEKEKETNKERKDKSEPEQLEISTSDDVDRKLKESLSDEADYEPTSTVTINTPDAYPEEAEEPMELDSVWSGQIVMAEVAKFHGKALPATGNCSDIDIDFGDKISVVGRIPYGTVWDYIARMKKMATKDIIVLQILPLDTDQDQASFSILFNYLSKRSRIGVIGAISDQFKDFYLYPHGVDSLLPAVLQPLTIPPSQNRNTILLGIIIRTKRGVRSTTFKPPPVQKSAQVTSKQLPLSLSSATTRAKPLPLPDLPPEDETRSYTPPLPDADSNSDPRKRKNNIELPKKAPVEDDDSPYSPASSEEDLPPLSKLPKIAATSAPEAALEAVQIQKRIEEMNRAIEEQTQQIQTLASTVPLLPIIAPVLAASIPGLESSESATASDAAIAPSVIPSLDRALHALKSIVPSSVVTKDKSQDSSAAMQNKESVDSNEPMELDIPLPPSPPEISSQSDSAKPYSPSRSLSPVPTLSMPEVAQISIPSNLQEILASIKQSKPPAEMPVSPPVSRPPSPEPLPPGVEDEDVVLLTKVNKTKPDRKTVFESDGVPEFVGVKSKQIKFALKLKPWDMDERIAPNQMDVDERIPINPSALDDRPIGVLGRIDQDDRLSSASTVNSSRERAIGGSRDEPILLESQDQDERILRLPLETDLETVTRQSRTRSTSSDKDKDDRRKHSRRRSDSHRQRPVRHRGRDDLKAEWDGSIRKFEDELRRRNRDIRDKEIERLRRRSETDSD